ncbi:MAG: bifunctional hydroxymethylpyrimidine kinase/phosphomethylpyrimidine kinase [Oceanicaulis sp.]|uniref:bifunctional hydroxymethylpyrimidine kinase/phosphomethylpyrimidine kinase n=1 Tax=Oceanicaulis sp. UBA2681 TaxID=1947007 RepID=UPI000C0B1B6E|nr:bifunctional hydroxymethylpyrimidine kinase/phosphomethylpyrimidine kinase [Oceanicaulis sp. UBA2681]MAP48540.1 bifunctional hydroxymethylpyrimidine kinase/phosphomethylpyrimidine kinase [Oceanicaulis sp.]|tara:strand:+ start:5227 stop:6105 length:879 start_codon:yes stop_codon:yes gene_type:complete
MTDETDIAEGEFENPKGRVLIVAGSDSSGGAGVQADIKTVTALGGYASTAITAVTVQNTKGVSGVHPIPDDVIAAQINAVLSDIGTDAIKTGMLGSVSTIEAVVKALDDEGTVGLPLIVDPVMVASSGDSLVSEDTAEAIRTILLPRASLITPNAPEAAVLAGGTIENMDDQRAAADELLEMGAKAVLVKGGHLEGSQIIDLLATRNGVRLFTRPRIHTRHTHGTGCTLASAIAALMAQGQGLDRAVEMAGDYLYEAIRRAPKFGEGHGPVQHGWTVNASEFAHAPVRGDLD